MTQTVENVPVKNGSESVKFKDLETLLQESLNNTELKVIDYNATKLLPPGENYCSAMVKFDVTIRKTNDAPEEELHLVGKTMNHTETPFIAWTVMFERELFVYAELMPMYRELEREAGVKESDLIDVAPGYIGYRFSLKDDSDKADEDSALLMQNIKVEGYYNCDRHVGMDMDHATLALKSLARYHALGMAMRQKRPEFAKRASERAKMPEWLSIDQLSEGYKSNLDLFRQTPSLNKHMDIIEKYYVPFIEGLIFDFEPEEPWVTLTHGDFWVNNMMFHKDKTNGKVDKVKFVDFQMYLQASPLMDLPYFFCGSLDDDAVANHFVDLLDIYFAAFIESLKRLDCDITPYTREAFDIELKTQALQMFPVCALSMKFFAFEVQEKDADNEELMSSVLEEEASDAYIHRLHRLMRIYEDRGWF